MTGDWLAAIETAAADSTLDDTQLVDLLADVRDTIRQLRLLDDELVARIADGKTQGELVADRATIRYSRSGEKWDRDAANRNIMSLERDLAASDRANAAVDPDTGEIVPTWEQALAVIDSYWLRGNPRKTPMREAGLDPDEYTEGGTRTVRIELA
jgi:hypothetical protein